MKPSSPRETPIFFATADFAIGSALRSVTRFATVAMDAHPEDAQQTVPDVVTEVAAEPAEDAPAEGAPTLDATAVEVVNDDDDDEGAVPLHRRGAHPEAWRMNGTLQTWRPIGKTGLTPENSEDEDEEDGLMIVAAAAPRE